MPLRLLGSESVTVLSVEVKIAKEKVDSRSVIAPVAIVETPDAKAVTLGDPIDSARRGGLDTDTINELPSFEPTPYLFGIRSMVGFNPAFSPCCSVFL